MSLDRTRGELLVAFAILGVIVYEFRTVPNFVGVELPLAHYMDAVFMLAGVLL